MDRDICAPTNSKTMKKVLLVAFGIFYMSQINAQANQGAETWTIAGNDNFNLSFPSTWKYDDSGDMGALFTLTSPFTDEEDSYNDYIQLSVLPVPGLNMTLDKHIESTVKDIPFFYKKADIKENRRDKKAGHDCHILSYSGEMNDFPLAHLQYIWLQNDKIYTLSFVGQPADFEKLKTVSSRIMDSFAFQPLLKK